MKAVFGSFLRVSAKRTPSPPRWRGQGRLSTESESTTESLHIGKTEAYKEEGPPEPKSGRPHQGWGRAQLKSTKSASVSGPVKPLSWICRFRLGCNRMVVSKPSLS